MKLNNVIILTIADFRRHFNFPAFWNSRMSFLRDMNPKKLSFFTPEDEENFDKIATWIRCEQNQSATEDVRHFGLAALSLFAKCNVTEKDLKKVIGMLDYTADIIVVPCNGILNLPGKHINQIETTSFFTESSHRERIHKIEIDGEGKRTATIFIGGTKLYELKDDECIYVSEINGCFVRLMDNRKVLDSRTLYLENCHGEFESILVEERFTTKKRVNRHPGVTQFGFVEDKLYFSNNKYIDDVLINSNNENFS